MWAMLVMLRMPSICGRWWYFVTETYWYEWKCFNIDFNQTRQTRKRDAAGRRNTFTFLNEWNFIFINTKNGAYTRVSPLSTSIVFVCLTHRGGVMHKLAPVPLSIFRSNSKFDENSDRSSFEYTRPITTIFYPGVFWIFIEFRIRSKYA